MPSLKSDTKSLLTLLLPLTNSGAISLPSKIVDSCPSVETLHLLKILLMVWLISQYSEDGVGVSKGAWSTNDGRLPGEMGGLLQTIVDGRPCLLVGIYKAGTYLDLIDCVQHDSDVAMTYMYIYKQSKLIFCFLIKLHDCVQRDSDVAMTTCTYMYIMCAWSKLIFCFLAQY